MAGGHADGSTRTPRWAPRGTGEFADGGPTGIVGLGDVDVAQVSEPVSPDRKASIAWT